jgi:hypothetical protein
MVHKATDAEEAADGTAIARKATDAEEAADGTAIAREATDAEETVNGAAIARKATDAAETADGPAPLPLGGASDVVDALQSDRIVAEHQAAVESVGGNTARLGSDPGTTAQHSGDDGSVVVAGSSSTAAAGERASAACQDAVKSVADSTRPKPTLLDVADGPPPVPAKPSLAAGYRRLSVSASEPRLPTVQPRRRAPPDHHSASPPPLPPKPSFSPRGEHSLSPLQRGTLLSTSDVLPVSFLPHAHPEPGEAAQPPPSQANVWRNAADPAEHREHMMPPSTR